MAGDWSVGLNSPTSFSQAQVLQELGRHLRSQYKSILTEPLPEVIADLSRRLQGPEVEQVN